MNTEIDARPIRSSDHHYVILVHGTFNKPEPGKYHWAVLDPATPDTFAQRLDERLAATKIGSVVNRMPGGERRTFVWNAGNTDSDRREGGWKLLQHILTVIKEDPNARIHLVGHSHGGNVILCALEHYYRRLADAADRYSNMPWWAWRIGDKKLSFLNNQPTDLYGPADALVSRIAGGDETLLSTLLKNAGSFLFESRPDTNPLDPESSEYRKYYCSSPTTNRLGRIVFLGTPFYVKKWRSRGVLEWLLDTVFNGASLVLYWGVIGYIVTTLLLVIPSLIFHGRFPWNLLSWPLATQIGYAGYVAWNTYVGFHGDLRRNGNVYWNSEPIERYSLDEPVFLRSTNTECDGRLSTLTVTAPYLDEALLGMIAEPLLLGRMRPELRKFVAPESSGRSGQRVASGERFTHMVVVRSLLSYVLQRIKGGILALVYLIIKLPWRAIYDLLLERLVLKAVFGAVSSTATGIPRSEYAGATIEPCDRANVPGLLNETFLDVTEVFLASPTQAPRAAESRVGTQSPADEAYDFLKNDECLRKRLAADQQWRTIEGEMFRIARFYHRQDVAAYSDELARRWLAIRTRATKFLESIALTHGRYYADDRVVNGIVEFLADGRVSSLSVQPSPLAPASGHSREEQRHLKIQGVKPAVTTLDNVEIVGTSAPGGTHAADLAPLLHDLVWEGNIGIARGFVTCAQYRMAAQELASDRFFFFPEHWRGLDYAGDGEPVCGLRASDAANFCSWLGRKFTGPLRFRLPTTSEARRVPPSAVGPLCWCEGGHRITCAGSFSYRKLYRESRASLPKSPVPFPQSGFGGLPIRGITVLNVNDPPVDPLIVHLVARGVFNRTEPDDLFSLPPSLDCIVMLIDDLSHARGSVAESREYATQLLGSLLKGLAADSYEECSRTYRDLAERLQASPQDKIISAIDSLKSHSLALIAHTAHLLDDIAKAASAGSEAEAFAWLQVAAARALEYAWHGHEWYTDTERQLEGQWPYLRRRLMDRLTGRHSEIGAHRNKLWQLYWWLRLSIARGNGEIPAVEGIRIVCESKRSEVEAALKAMT
jgi:hypothetical protein